MSGPRAAIPAFIMGDFRGTSTGRAPWWSMTSTSTSGGAISLTYFVNAAAIFSGSWSGTSRIETLARARDGMMVLAPSPP